MWKRKWREFEEKKNRKNAIKLYLLDFTAITNMNIQQLWPPAQKKAGKRKRLGSNGSRMVKDKV